MSYTRAIMSRVVEIAKAAAKAHAAGAKTYTAHQHADGTGASQVLDLVEGGMCNRFVRQVYEVALGIPEQTWLYRAGRAVWTLDSLEAASKRSGAGLEPGDIVGIHTGKSGHIAIYVGDGMVAENTISDTRGKPRKAGTKVTPYSALAEPGILVTLRTLAPAPEVRVTDKARIIDGRAWAPVREMAQGLGLRVDASRLAAEDRIVLSDE